jgi:hypothetical protein
MNENQFEALLAVFSEMAEELMFIRDELTGLRNLYAQANGFETDDEYTERLMASFEEHCDKIKASKNDKQTEN